MQIKEIKHHQLYAYINSQEYKHSAHIAISKQRAMSHIRNPRAKADDLVLVLFYVEKEMVAYLGVFADDLHFSTGIEHVGWLSCMWVNPIMRGKGVAKTLINTVFKAWGYKILVTEFTPAAEGLYKRTGQFIDLAKPKGVRGYLRLNSAYLLSKKDSKWNKWKWLLNCIDMTFNIPNALRLKLKSINCPTFEYISEIDEETWDFVEKHKSKELMNRNMKDLQWLANNPWLISSGIKDHTASRYNFSSTDKSFVFLNVKIYDNEMQLSGFLILSIRNKNIKIPYAYYKKGTEESVMKVVYKHMLELKLNMLTIFHSALVKQVKTKPSPFFLKRDFKRHYIIGKALREQMEATPDFTIQDGDADAAFT